MKHLPAILILLMSCAAAQAQTTTSVSLPEGPLTATINAVEGMVQVRAAPGEPWQKATIGMHLKEGAELRTGPKSAVRFVIPPDQIVTLDRLGTLQLLRANFENGKFITDLGMKYGRTRYDIEAAGREHDAKVRSPSSVLAVKGTRTYLFDQPPFAPQAVSFTGRARFRDSSKDVGFGDRSFSRITTLTDSAAQASLNETNNDPRTDFAGRTLSESLLGLQLGGYSAPGDYAVLATFARPGTTTTSLPTGAALIQRDLGFNLFWNGSPFSDVQLSVTNPIGQTLSMSNPSIPGVGTFDLVNGSIADGQGFGGFRQLTFGPAYLPGVYTVNLNLATAGRADATVLVIDNVGVDPPPLATINRTLDVTTPSATATVTAPAPSAPPSRRRGGR